MNADELHEHDLLPDPIALVRRWFAEAEAFGLEQHDAMTLATATPDGRPSARAVLLKGIDQRGFAFFTNYESRKARELDANPHAALVLLWIPLQRQVRVGGRVERLGGEESDAYFATRPRGSQLGAWASEQSRPLPDRGELERRFAALDERYAGGVVPRPPHWGGYRVEPDEIELWQGRANRLHDRFRYTRGADGAWQHVRLAP
ncbi:MAG: pyridoxamine 5'-phosphate oxidase [Actinobacteria bacterium]|nr:pyridoxamine 5'-phosphate oxidase [Actinomycetota bacterium]